MPIGPKESSNRIARRRRDGARLGHALRALGATLRYQPCSPPVPFPAFPSPVIFVLWHQYLASAPLWYGRIFPPGRRNTALVSASGDGELLAAALRVFQIDAVRGSRSRGGAEALRVLLRALESGSDITVTPDGPRGPRHVLQPGIFTLAKLSGAPLVPARIESAWCARLRTWDRFELPLPFSRTTLRFGGIRTFGPGVSDADIAAWLQPALGD